MTRTRIAAAAVLTLGLLAPVGLASTASAAPKVKECSDAALAKDHKQNKANAKAADAKNNGNKAGHSKPRFVYNGTIDSVDATAGTITFKVRGGTSQVLRNCLLTVIVTADTKITRNHAAASIDNVLKGDHINAKGTTKPNLDDATKIDYTATRVSVQSKH
jgi:hypothetical protein